METTEQPAQNARTNGATSATLASPSTSTPRASDTSAGTVAGTAARTTTAARRPLSPAAVQWAREARHISDSTLSKLGVRSGIVNFRKAGRSEALFFVFPDGKWKARSFPQKDHTAEPGIQMQFWGLREFLAERPKRVFIVEGEMDRCAMVEAGFSPAEVLSVPNGAKERTPKAQDADEDTPPEQRGLGYVVEALQAGLSSVKQFIFCGDMDAPGLTLRSDMVQVLGAARFHTVDWPEGCKDANDMLRTDGPAALRDLCENGALAWPVEGLYRLSQLPEQARLTLWFPGFSAWEGKLNLAPGLMSVCTGHPNHGKTVMMQQMWFNIVREYDVPIAMASFETGAKPHIRKHLRTFLTGRLEKNLSIEEKAKADRWIDDRYLFMVHPERAPTLDWYLDMMEVAVVRHGARIGLLDPWNRLEGSRPPGENETDYIARCLRTIANFASDMQCHMQIIAHPAKQDRNRRGQPPMLDEISGSKNWENMVDQGFVVHRSQMFDPGARRTECDVFYRKSRFDELGYPCALPMNYIPSLGRFVSNDPEALPDNEPNFL